MEHITTARPSSLFWTFLFLIISQRSPFHLIPSIYFPPFLCLPPSHFISQFLSAPASCRPLSLRADVMCLLWADLHSLTCIWTKTCDNVCPDSFLNWLFKRPNIIIHTSACSRKGIDDWAGEWARTGSRAAIRPREGLCCYTLNLHPRSESVAVPPSPTTNRYYKSQTTLSCSLLVNHHR